MASALERCSAEYDFIHLSNILDWLPRAEAQRTLELAWQALRPGGRVLIRQLNSSLDIPGLGPSFSWEPQAWQETDRSLIYRAIHLGRKS
jgi:S-adenosylmethionine-diacylglycerol 3-amino-3-carboxypropyl transferase